MHSLLRSLYVSPVPPRRDDSAFENTCSAECLEARLLLTNGNLSPVSNTDMHPNRAVVQLEITWDTNNNGQRDSGDISSQCSGALIGDYHVLTAGHCVYNRGSGTNATGGRGWADWIQVFAGRDDENDRPYGVANATLMTAPTLWTQGTSSDYYDGDIGLITLDRSLGSSSAAGHFGFGGVSNSTLSSSDLEILHYPGTAQFGFDGDEQYHSGPFRTTSVSTENFTYSLQDAWTTGGSSGAPIFADSINVGGTVYNNFILGVVSRGDYVQPGQAGTDTATRVGNWFSEIQNWRSDDPAPSDKPALYDYDEWFDTNTSSVSTTSVAAGGTLSASARIFNGGTQDASNFTVRFYASTDTTISGASDTFLGDVTVSANQYDYVTANWTGTVPASLAGGSYYIGWFIDPANTVAEFGEGSNTGYHSSRVSVTNSLSPDAYEDNDDYASAHDFGAVDSLNINNLTIDASGDDDYYAFTALGSGSASVGLNFTHSAGDVDLRVYSDQGVTSVGSSTSSSDDELVSFTAVAGTRYYVRVYGYAGATNSYDLAINAPGASPDSLETNDTLAQATTLPTVGPGTNVAFLRSLNIHDGSDEDWFVFDVTANSAQVSIDLTFTDSVGDIDVSLHSVSGGQTTYITGATSSSDNESITQTLAAGQYAIRVYGYSGARNIYGFDFQATGTGGGGGNPLTDIIGRTSSGTWWVGESDGSSFTQQSFGRWGGPTWTDTQYADFNGDGLADVAARSSNGTWWVGLSDGTRFATSAWSRWSTSAGWTNIATGDFNGDGMADIVGRSSSGTWWVGLSNGSGFVTSTFGRWSGSWTDVQYADFTGDGVTDVGARSANGTWWFGQTHQGQFHAFASQRWSTTTTWADISTGDFNGDGQADVIGRTSSGTWWVGITIPHSLGPGIQTTSFGRWGGSSWQDVQYADFNGDGRTDIAGRAASGTWWVGLSDGSSITTSSWSNWNSSAGWHNIMTGDFNGDGMQDVAGRTSSGTWWVGLSNGSRFVTSAFGNWSTGVAWADPGAANFA